MWEPYKHGVCSSMVERLTVDQETKDRYLPYTLINARVVKLENTTVLSTVASACRFESYHGYHKVELEGPKSRVKYPSSFCGRVFA